MYNHFPMGGLTGLLIVIVLAIVLFRLVKGQPDERKSISAREILDERYARGEIDAEEYHERKKHLED